MGLSDSIRSINMGYRHPSVNSIPDSVKKKDNTVVRGRVVYIDHARMVMTCELLHNGDIVTDIPIAMPFASNSAYISGMPEKRSVAVLVLSQGTYIPVAYLPSYVYALEQKHINVWPDDIPAKENDLFYRHRELRDGEVNFGSAEGAEILLSHDVTLENPYGDNVIIRDSDHAIVSTSLNNSIFASGVWINAGVIQRNALKSSNVANGQFARQHILRDGKIIYQLKPEDNDVLSKYYSEYLIEVEEHGSPELQSNSINDQIDLDKRSPSAIFSLGNFVGNSPYKDKTYGKVLGVSLFKSHDAKEGAFSFRTLTKDEPEKYGLAATLYKPKKDNYEQGAIFAIDKEGHFYQYIPAGTGGGLGSGRSMSIFAEGNKKEIWGADTLLGNSWDILLEGGLKWKIGKHNNNDYDLRSTSMDIVTDGKVYFQYGVDIPRAISDFDQPDKLVQNIDRYRKIEKIAGSERKEITGIRESIIEGGDYVKIKGLKKENITGFYNTTVGGNRNVNVGDTYSLGVTNEGQESFGSKVIKCIKGSHELTIYTMGDIKEKINIRGNKSITIGSGNIKESILIAGGKTFQTLTGDYKVNLLAKGNITQKTAIGSIVGATKLGKMDLKATLGAVLSSKAGTKVEGLKINLKTPVPTGKVITKATSLCYITGVPNIGTPTITA